MNEAYMLVSLDTEGISNSYVIFEPMTLSCYTDKSNT